MPIQSLPRIRPATAADAEGILEIYAPYVRDTVISFELEPPDVAEMRRRVLATLETHPWLVCELSGELAGFAYATEHRRRPAYQWSVDVSVYVDRRRHRSGIGRALYRALLPVLALQGFHVAHAGIALPNAGSVGLHESLGFEPVGVYRSVGYKLGAWRDVGWWRLALREPAGPPEPPLLFPAVRDRPEVAATLSLSASFLAAGQARRPPGLRIELARPDSPEARSLILALDEHLRSLYPTEHHFGPDVPALLGPEVSFLLARDGGDAVGCGALRLFGGAEPQAEVKRMFVRPDRRGRGVAQALLAALEQRAAAAGAAWVRLETGFRQPSAQRLYERAGYVRRAGFGDEPDNPNSLFYEKRLEASARGDAADSRPRGIR